MELELQSVIESLRNLDQDIRIFHCLDTQGQNRGFEGYGRSTYLYAAESWYTGQEDVGFSITQINEFLISQGYRQIIKPNTDDRPFAPSWDYRLRRPSKPVMGNWLLNYYLHQLEQIKHTIVVNTNPLCRDTLQKAKDSLQPYQDIYNWLFDHLYKKEDWSTNVLMKWAFSQYAHYNQLHDRRSLSDRNKYRYGIGIYNRLGKSIQQYQEYVDPEPEPFPTIEEDQEEEGV
jgi:hypothetical protein